MPRASQDYGGQDPGNGELVNPFGLLPGDDDLMPRRSPRAKAARKKSRVHRQRHEQED